MTAEEKDPFKELFQALPEIEPSPGLRSRILYGIRAQHPLESWAMRPALALASLVVVSLLGLMFSISYIAQKQTAPAGSPIERWAHADVRSESLVRAL